MGKYKKRLRAEKAKVKLKKTKLPKGQNITDVSFKVKKIITTEQLRVVNENELVSSWNVPLKDLLIQLGHHNKSSRLNAINGIKEIINNYNKALQGPELKNTIMKVLGLMCDIESKIRAAAVSLLDTIFSQLHSTDILSFYEILNIHLACAMTHRLVAIQKDSLSLADLLIKYAPEAIKSNFKIIIVNFIRILSSYKYGARSEIFLTRGSKKDLEENRIAIFQRLGKILKICYPDENVDVKEQDICIKVSDCKSFSKRILTAHRNEVVDLSDILKSEVFFKKITYEDYEEDFKLLVSQIIPLLFETWAEFSPPADNNGFIEECILKENTAKLLGSILEIIMILYEKSLKMGREIKKLLHNKYGNQFVKLFLSSFPYLPNVFDENLKNSKEKELLVETTANFTKNYQSQNLTICYLTYSMKLNISNELRKILDNYVLQVQMVRKTKCEVILSKIIELVVLVPTRQKRVEEFMSSAFRCYKHTTNVDFQNRLLRILSKIAVNVEYAHLVKIDSVSEWIAYLIKGMSRNKIRYEVLQTLLKIIQRKLDPNAIKEIERKFMDILQNLRNIEIEGCDQLVGKKCIANILYWCDINVIRSALETNILEEKEYPDEIKSYLMKIFQYKTHSK